MATATATAGALIVLLCAGGVAEAVPASATTLTAGQLVAIASGAPLYLPYAVAVDTAGDVFIANTYAREIDEITASTGVLSVIAGGGDTEPSSTAPITATSAQLDYPNGVAVNAAGTLVYIADSSHFDIEEVNTSTGDLSVIAGNGVTGAPTDGLATSSHLDQPEGVAVDAAGNVYIADSYNDDVEELNISTGDLSVIAGKGVAGAPTAGLATNSYLNQPTGVAVNAAGTVVYVADQDNDTIDEITNPGLSGSLSVIAGGGSTAPSATPITATTAVLEYPDWVAVDASGNLYISDMDAFEVDEISASTGDLSVIAGGGGTTPSTTPVTATAALFNQPRGVAVDTLGNVYIADAGNNQIDEVGATGLLTAPSFSAESPATSAAVGTSYGYTFVAGGSPPPSFALMAGAPSWLSIGSTTGTVVGTPPTGTTSFTYSVTASDGTLPNATAGPFTVVTTAASAPAAFSSHSPALTATVGTSYGYTFAASGFPAPTFTLSGAPSWLTIGASTGTVVGTPPAGNTGFSYTVTAMNASLPLGISNLFNVVTSPAAVVPVTVPIVPTTVTAPPVTVPSVPPVTVLALTSPPLVPTGGGVAATPAGAGYWSLSASGALSEHGNAGAFGSENTIDLNAPIVAVNSTTNGQGYWLAASDGGVFNFGNAKFFGSLGSKHLGSPVVAMSRTPDNDGYLLATANGSVFAFGDATLEGSRANMHLNRAITSMVSSSDGGGYLLAAADGGVFAYGDAHFEGSLGATDINRHIVGIASTPDGKGYWLVSAKGTVTAFGDAKSFGSLPATGTRVIVGIVADANIGYRLITASGSAIAFGTTPTN